MDNFLGNMIAPLGRAFNWSGRASRKEFWLFQITAGVIGWFALPCVMRGSWLALALCVLCGFSELALTIRRLHDSGRSGCWVLLPVLALLDFVLREDLITCGLVYALFLLVFMTRTSENGRVGLEVISSRKTTCHVKVGGLRETVVGLAGLLAGSAVAILLSSAFIIHAYTVYVAAKTSGLIATMITLVLPVLSEIYWFFRLLFTEGLVNGYTILLLVFLGCLMTIGLFFGLLASNGGE